MIVSALRLRPFFLIFRLLYQMLINQFFFVLHSMNRQGECYRHAMTCGAGIGIFLMLRVCFLLNVMIYVFSCMNISKQGM